jgi:hypothetical protein
MTLRELYREVCQFINGMDAQHWLFALIGVVVIGLICLRGFGSRSSY